MTHPRWLRLALAVTFATAHTQSPLYYSNQNQYFLHGLARAGDKPLKDDWLAHTADPVPIFSAGVAFCACFGEIGELLFQAIFFAALIGYFLALWWLVRRLPFAPRTDHGDWLLAALLIAAHAAIFRFASDRLLGADYPWFLQCGLASQYVLGPGLQPSVVGILLVAAVAAYLVERPVLACGLAAGATLIHSTYLLPAGMLVAGFLVNEAVRRKWKAVALGGALAIALVLPSVIYTVRTFAPTDAATFGEAQRILADVRIPHHTRPDRWFDWVACLQVLWMLLGIAATWRTRLFVPLCVTAGLALVGTLAVMVTNHPTLSLLFPWRVTAVLVPVSTAVIFTRGVRWAERRPWVSFAFAAVLITVSVFGGMAERFLHYGYREPEGEDAALRYVANTAKPGQLYLVPARFAKPSTARGVYSSTFTRGPDPNAPVYFEMARFRLATRAPLFVDFKAIPYKDTDVIEWERRVAASERWFKASDWDATGIADEIAAEHVTHILVPVGAVPKCTRLDLVIETEVYNLYLLK